MKSSTALFFQTAVVFIGICILALLLWEPHLEGRNAHATTFEIYFNDPFLAYVYVASIPVFLALYRSFGLFGDVRASGTFSQVTVDALRTIKRCAIAIVIFAAGGAAYIVAYGDGEDRPAGVFMTFLVTLGASGVGVAAAMAGRSLEGALRRSASSRD